MNISGTDDPVLGDFFRISGTGIPPDVECEFHAGGSIQTHRPDFVRPHCALFAPLPATLATGSATLKFVSPTAGVGNTFGVTIGSGSPKTQRVLNPGKSKTDPYSIVLIANPAIEQALPIPTPSPPPAATFVADPVLSDHGKYASAVAYCLNNLFNVREDVARMGNRDNEIRIVSVFDESLTPNAADAMTRELSGSVTMEVRHENRLPFLAKYGLQADVMLVIYSSAVYSKVHAWFSNDEPAGGGVNYTLDGATGTHGGKTKIPGAFPIPEDIQRRKITALHEFCHAATSYENGAIVDLYQDNLGHGMAGVVNKKWRLLPTDPVPTNFSTYNSTSYQSDQYRNPIGYQGGWTSYHAQRPADEFPNVMDDFNYVVDTRNCVLDRSAHTFLSDRLTAKLNR